MKPNVVKFPGKPVRNMEDVARVNSHLEHDEDADLESPLLDRPEPAAGARLLYALGRGLRFALFIVLYWLRLPIVGLCSIVSVLTLFATLFALYAFPDKTPMLWGFGVTSISTFFVAWCYDFVLMKLSPLPMVDSL